MASALLVVGNVTLSTGDQMISDLLDGTEAASSRTDTVETRGQADPPANFDAYDYIVVSETVSSGTFWTNYSALGTEAKPVMVLENGNFDEFRIATSAGNTTSMAVHCVDATHHMAAGFAVDTNVTVSTGNEGSQIGTAALGVGADQVWSKASDEANWGIVGYDTGTDMTSGTAPARRVAFCFKDSAMALLTADGKTIFLAVVEWTNGEDVAGGTVSLVGSGANASTGSGDMTVYDPSNLVAAVAGDDVTLTWDA